MLRVSFFISFLGWSPFFIYRKSPSNQPLWNGSPISILILFFFFEFLRHFPSKDALGQTHCSTILRILLHRWLFFLGIYLPIIPFSRQHIAEYSYIFQVKVPLLFTPIRAEQNPNPFLGSLLDPGFFFSFFLGIIYCPHDSLKFYAFVLDCPSYFLNLFSFCSSVLLEGWVSEEGYVIRR